MLAGRSVRESEALIENLNTRSFSERLKATEKFDREMLKCFLRNLTGNDEYSTEPSNHKGQPQRSGAGSSLWSGSPALGTGHRLETVTPVEMSSQRVIVH